MLANNLDPDQTPHYVASDLTRLFHKNSLNATVKSRDNFTV